MESETVESSSASSTTPSPPAKARLFNRERSIHQILGGGKNADVLLWKHKFLSAGIVFVSTIAWLLLEKFEYSLLTILATVLLILFVVLFIWSNVAAFLKRSPPPLPKLELSEKMVTNFASVLCEKVNKVLACAHGIALGKDFRVFLKVVVVLLGLSVVGGWFHFLTLVYILILVSHTLPVIYERYQDSIDKYAAIAADKAHKQYRTIDAVVSTKVLRRPPKVKKSE